MKIKAAVLMEQGAPQPYAKSQPMKVVELDLAPPGPGELLVKTGAAGLCHSDLSMISGVIPKRTPMVPGHEGAGVVVEVGEGVTAAKPGDHVVMSFVPSCGTCEYCAAGRPNICQTAWDRRQTGALLTGAHRLSMDGEPVDHTNGVSCYAEYMVAAEGSVVVIDPEVPMVDAALFGCAVATGMGAIINTAKVPPGATVAVIGLGGVGLSALLGAKVAGAGRIIAVDIDDAKLGLASQLGADETYNGRDPDVAGKINEATKGGVEYVIEISGVVAGMKTAYDITRRGGTLVSASLSNSTHTFDLPQANMVLQEKSILGSMMGGCVFTRDVPRYISLYKQGRLPVDKLRSGEIGLDGLNAGFDRLAAGDAVRQMLVMHEEFRP
ncbi:MAG: zinc-binding dehydrogenase [Pseudomonadota bacterium]